MIHKVQFRENSIDENPSYSNKRDFSPFCYTEIQIFLSASEKNLNILVYPTFFVYFCAKIKAKNYDITRK